MILPREDRVGELRVPIHHESCVSSDNEDEVQVENEGVRFREEIVNTEENILRTSFTTQEAERC